MWFILRVLFCVGMVYSMTPGGGEALDVARSMPSILAEAPLASGLLGDQVTRDVLKAALAGCETDRGPCLDAARRLAGKALPEKRAGAPLVADTLTAADRAPAWRGPGKGGALGASRGREARPST